MERKHEHLRRCTIRNFICDNINSSMPRNTNLIDILSVSAGYKERDDEYTKLCRVPKSIPTTVMIEKDESRVVALNIYVSV